MCLSVHLFVSVGMRGSSTVGLSTTRGVSVHDLNTINLLVRVSELPKLDTKPDKVVLKNLCLTRDD